jgi:SSS family transporter
MMESTLHFLDWLILAVYLLIVSLIGVYFSRKQKTLDEVVRAGAGMGWLPVGFSLMAALNSGIDYVQTPPAVYQYGMVWVATFVSWFFLWPYVSQVTIRFYRRMDVYSAYEYLECRFDVSVRTLAASIFVFWRVAWMGTALYVPCLAINAASGGTIPITPLAIVLGTVVTTYTMLGGMRAVVWTDVIQFFIMFSGLAATTAIVLYHVPGGISEIISVSWKDGKFDMWAMPEAMAEATFAQQIVMFFETDVTLIGVCLNVIIARFAMFTADQVAIQRFATARSIRDAKSAFIINAVADTIWMVVLGLIGLGIYVFYHHQGLPENLTGDKLDNVLPYFMSTMFPVGCTGLVIAAISAASLSSVDSAISSTSSIVTVDFYNRLVLHRVRPNETVSDEEQRAQVAVTRVAALVFGILGVIVACNVSRLGLIYVAAAKLIGAFNGPVFGIFLLGMFSARTRTVGVLIGGFMGLLTGCYASFFSSLGWVWPPTVGVLTTLIVGYVCSLVGGGGRADPNALTARKVLSG